MTKSSINPLAGPENFPAILTKQQAAAYVQATPRYLERAVKAGRLRALRPTGKLWRVRRSELEKFLESGATTTGGRQ
jgi:excisionase family DNA binding protein